MSVTSNPKTIAQLLAAEAQIGAFPFRSLIVGQIGTDGTATAEQHYDNVERLTNAQVKGLFGTKSELTGRILRAREIILGRSPLSVIGLDESGTGVAAELDITVTGTATEDGILTFKAIDDDRYTFNVDVLEGDLANDVALAIKAKIDDLIAFPATAGAVALGVFTLTANDLGTIPNKFTVSNINSVAGLTVVAGQFSSGANDPVTTTIFDNVQEVRFHAISWPWENDFAVVDTLLDSRQVFNNDVLQGVAYIGYDDTEANITDKVNGTTPLNTMNLIFMGNRAVTGVNQIVTPPDWRAAEFMAIEAMRLTDGVPIAEYVTTSAPADVIGGTGSASLAYYNTPLARTDIANASNLFSGTAQNNLLSDGYTIIGVNSSNTTAIMGQVVSTYKFDKIGNPDNSFKFLNYIRTGYYALELFFRTLKSINSQARLTEGDIVANRIIRNKKAIEGQCIDIYTLLSSQDYMLTMAGQEATKYFNTNLQVDLDIQNGIVTISGKLPIVTQIRTINISFQLSFSISG